MWPRSGSRKPKKRWIIGFSGRARSSAGEHTLHTGGVTGSIPVAPTSLSAIFRADRWVELVPEVTERDANTRHSLALGGHRRSQMFAGGADCQARDLTRYSQLYIERGRPQADSNRARDQPCFHHHDRRTPAASEPRRRSARISGSPRRCISRARSIDQGKKASAATECCGTCSTRPHRC